MSPNVGLTPNELPLTPDFAAQVLAQADATMARRRYAGALVIAAAGILIGAALFLRSTVAPDAPAQPVQLTSLDKRAVPASRDSDDARAMVYLFPDATPLVQFEQSYSAAMSGIGVDEQSGNDASAQEDWL